MRWEQIAGWLAFAGAVALFQGQAHPRPPVKHQRRNGDAAPRTPRPPDLPNALTASDPIPEIHRVVLIAPGGKHLTFSRDHACMVAHIGLDPENLLYRPSVDVTMRSAVQNARNPLLGTYKAHAATQQNERAGRHAIGTIIKRHPAM